LFPPALRKRLVAIRRDLHRHPELSFQEEQTAQRLYDELSELEPVHLERVAQTGVVARIKGESAESPVVAIRGDIDALPIQEESGLEFSSQHAGIMHACGHDVHATWAVGAAHLLSNKPAKGDVLIVLQPAEETGEGAAAMLKTGALEGAAAIFGAHVDRRFALGGVVADVGPLAAAADTFTIELEGSGAHGARPHEAADPIVAAGGLINALQTIVSRHLNPAHSAVVTVGSIHAGTAPNVIPDAATLSGTLRAVDPATRKLLHEEVRRIAESTAQAYGVRACVDLSLGTPPIVNKERPIVWAREAVASLMGEAALVPLGFLNMAGEDFALYLEEIPGCFLRIGARESGGEVIPAHTPRFFPAEESIFVGAAVLAETARVAALALAG
jgi:hippurate hydrolase